jgi:hypothetical protein
MGRHLAEPGRIEFAQAPAKRLADPPHRRFLALRRGREGMDVGFVRHGAATSSTRL